MQNQSLAKDACIYLKEKWKAVSRSSNMKVNNFYNDVLTYLLDEQNPPHEQSLTKATKYQSLFLPLIEKFQEREQQQFLCSKKFPGEQDKFFSAFHCYDCDLQENSIVCVQCFSFAKHKGHHYQLIEIIGGCCDCGDDTKWNKDSFCQKHTMSSEAEQQTQSEVQKQFFWSFCGKALEILCKLYKAYKNKKIKLQQFHVQNGEIQIQKTHREQSILAYILKIVDAFGYNFLNSLVIINKNRYWINQLTREWLQQQSPYSSKFIACLPIKEQMLRFTELRLSGKVCVDLYLILFNRAEKFRREVTISYFRLYSEIPHYINSAYRDFSSQIFSSSDIVLELISNKEIKPLAFKRSILKNYKGKTLQNEFKAINQDYKRFFNDMNYLINLKDESFRAYWRCFSHEEGFQSIIAFEEVFNQNEEYLKLAHKHSFFIEESTLVKVINIIDKMYGDKEFIVCNLKRLTLKLLERYFSEQTPVLSNSNLFFSYERMWTVFLFAYIHCFRETTDFYTFGRSSQINELLRHINSFQSGPKEINKRLAAFKLDINTFSALTEVLLKQLLKRFFKISQIMKSNSKITENMSFAMTYYKSKHLVYSIDAFLLKFVLVFNGKANKSIIIAQMNTYFQNLDQQFSKNVEKAKKAKKAKKSSIQETRQIAILESQEIIMKFHNFLNLISESIHFNYHELILLSRFKNLVKKDKYENRFISFYGHVFNTWAEMDKAESFTQFKKAFKDLFFEEEHYFQKFVNSFDQKIENNSSQKKQQPINIDHFFNLRYKFNHSDYVGKFLKKISYNYIHPSFRQKQKLNIISQTKHLEFVGSWLAQSIKITQLQKQIINDLTKQLYKIHILQMPPNYNSYFAKDFVQLYAQSDSDQKQSVYSFLNEKIREDIENYLQDTTIKAKTQNQKIGSQPNRLANHQQQMDPCNHQRQLQQMQSERMQATSNLKNFVTFDIQLGVQINRTCILAQQCKFARNLNTKLYEICFISLTNMHGAFQVDKNQKLMAFSTCGHLVHRPCFEALSKQSAGKTLKCKKCRKNFNFLLTQFENFSKSDNQAKRQLIFQDFSEVSQFLQHRKMDESVKLQLFKSIVAFLLSSVTIDDFALLRKAFLLYKNLFRKLKFQVEKTGKKETFRKYKNIIKMPSQSIYINFIDVVIQLVALEFNISNYQSVEELKVSPQYQKPLSYIKKVISFFNAESNRWSFEGPSQYILQLPIQKFNLQSFPPSLAELHRSRQCWKCHSTKRHSYYMCLSHTQNLKEANQYCVCFKCVSKWVRQHLKEEKDHLNEALILRTDTGEVYYFFMDGAEKEGTLMLHAADSIYMNQIMACYEVNKRYKMKDFYMSKKRVRHVINSVRSWNYVLSANPIRLDQ